jgi:hypothetical protein
MKKNERLKAIVREWLENKIGFSLSDKLAIKMVAEIIETEDEKPKKDLIDFEYISNELSKTFREKPKETWREALEQASEHLKTQDSTIHYQSEKDAEPKEESDWISVNDRLPNKTSRIIFKTISGKIIDGYRLGNVFYDSKYDSIITSNSTHWKYKDQ